ncbi:MAG: NAD(+)/NADH kinase [Rikenellaceae bacterium]
MKIIIFSRPSLKPNLDYLRHLITEIELRDCQYTVNEEFAASLREHLGLVIPKSQIYREDVGDQPERTVMICYGGDGTLLEGVHRLGGRPIVVVGVNTGRLGFLTCTAPSSIAELFDRLDRDELRIESRAMIAAKGDFSGGEWLRAANEFAIHRQGASMVEVATYIDGELVATYHGDGVIVATPTGSTAYSLSAGGAVMAPHCGCWIISPLAPHNITMRPVVVSDRCRLDLRVRMRDGGASISLDNRTYEIAQGTEVSLMRAKNDFYLGLDRNISFYQTLRDKMMWGVDLRG